MKEAYAGQMRVLAQLGRVADALATFDTLSGVLARELNVEPNADTRALAEILRVRPNDERRLAPRAPFIGRTQEKAELLALLERAASGWGAGGGAG